MPELGRWRWLFRAVFALTLAGSVVWLVVSGVRGDFEPVSLLSLLVSIAALAGDAGERRWQHSLPGPSVPERAEELGLAVRTPKTLRDESEPARVRALDAELAVVCLVIAFVWILVLISGGRGL